MLFRRKLSPTVLREIKAVKGKSVVPDQSSTIPETKTFSESLKTRGWLKIA